MRGCDNAPMIFANAPQPPEPSRARISALYRADEVACIEALVPKAGGPRYLARFATERARSVNTAATGGNVALLSLEDAE